LSWLEVESEVESMGNAPPNAPKVGYHILQIQPGSPGEKAELVPFFDFIIAAGGFPLDKEDGKMVELLKGYVGKELKLIVYNTRTETTRETTIIPNDNWGGIGVAGISIRFCSFDRVNENVWHVLEVYQNSPAEMAGLQARTDYIVGTPELLFNDSEDFFTLINSNIGKPVPLYTYSIQTDNIRLVTITPSRSWGGNGTLGCDVGYGYLHRIPITRAAFPPRQSPTPSTHSSHPALHSPVNDEHLDQQGIFLSPQEEIVSLQQEISLQQPQQQLPPNPDMHEFKL